MNINVNDISKFIDSNFNVGNGLVQLKNLEILIEYLNKNNIDLMEIDNVEMLVRQNRRLNSMLEIIIQNNDEELILNNKNIAFLASLYKSRKELYFNVDDDPGLTRDTYTQYLNEMARYRRLSKKEEQEVIKRIADGDEDAKRILIEANLKLVIYTVMLYFSAVPNKMDLIQVGNETLINAVDKFDHTAGYQFSTYATSSIKHGILRYINYHSRQIRIPQYLAQESYKIRDFISKYEAKYGEEPSNELISNELGIDISHIEKILSMREPVSLNQFKTDDENEIVDEILDTIEHPNMSGKTMEEKVFDADFRNYIFTTDILNEKERKILIYRFGLIDDVPMCLTEVGKILGLTHQRIKQIEDNALIKLRFSPFIQAYYEKNTDAYKVDLEGMDSRKIMKYYRKNVRGPICKKKTLDNC